VESEKYTPTQEDLEKLELTLREINEKKFQSLDSQSQVVTPDEEPLIEPEQPQEIQNIEEEPVQESEISNEETGIKRLSYLKRNA
jgi:hypothetical protein